MNCPNCNNKITGSQILHHKWSKPIICSNCNQSFIFHKKEWYQAYIPSALSAFFVIFNVMFGKAMFDKNTQLVLLISSMALLFITAAWSVYKIKDIKLVPSSQTKT